jgi:hypothetical protein
VEEDENVWNGGHANTCNGKDNKNKGNYALSFAAQTSSLMSDGNDDDSVNRIPMADIIGGDQPQVAGQLSGPEESC